MTRWIHVVAGILWIGLLYFFNWVNGPFAATMDGETKKKVVPELMPRTLYWFRWGAAWTWFSGVLLLLLVFYHTHEVIDGKDPEGWNVGIFLLLAVVFLGVFLYDFLMTNVCKSGVASFFGGWFLTTVMLYLMSW
ncbi:MAG: urate hydroxylase PuuD, partial [Planctomycetota bacterium]